MGTTNKNTFLQKIKRFFTSKGQIIEINKKDLPQFNMAKTKLSKSRTIKTEYSHKQTVIHGQSWWKRLGLTYKAKKLLPLNQHPIREFGTFSKVKPLWPWR